MRHVHDSPSSSEISSGYSLRSVLSECGIARDDALEARTPRASRCSARRAPRRAPPRPRGARRCRSCAPRRRGSRSRRSAAQNSRASARVTFWLARVEGGVVADEPEHVDRLLAGVLDLEVELVASSARACGARSPKELPDLWIVCSAVCRLAGSSPSSTSAPAQLVDDRRLLDADRAGLDAGVALHAGPDRVGAHAVLADHRAASNAPFAGACPRISTPSTPPTPTSAHRRVRLLAQLEHHVARRQRPAGGQAGQASWHLPHFVQASSWSRCTPLKSASAP